MHNYYFNDKSEQKEFTHISAAQPGTMAPFNATREPVPAMSKGQWAVWTGSGWALTPDHRPEYDEHGVRVEGTGTPYWMPEDAYKSEPRYMSTVGALPAGASTEPPLPELDMAKSIKRAEINALRDVKETDYFVYGGVKYDASNDSVRRILTHALASKSEPTVKGSTFSIRWTSYDNEEVEVTADDLSGMVDAIAALETAMHEHANYLKSVVEDLETAEAVMSFNAEQGWPVPETL